MAIALVTPAAVVAWPHRPVAYFYNEAISAVPVGVTINDAQTLKVAPGHVSMAVRISQNMRIVVRTKAGERRVNAVPELAQLKAKYVRGLVYILHAISPQSPPDPIAGAAAAITETDYRRTGGSVAPIAVVDETPHESADPHARGVAFRTADGKLSAESTARFGDVAPTFGLRPGSYDLIGIRTDRSPALMKAKQPLGRVTKADFHPGRIAIYALTLPGQLEHVLDLMPDVKPLPGQHSYPENARQ